MSAEEKVIPKFKPHSVSSLRKVLNQYDNEKITFSRFVEILNTEAQSYLSHTIAERLGDHLIQNKINRHFSLFQSKDRTIAREFAKWARGEMLKGIKEK
ncbi:hypothetical protein FGF1_03610 [Flavobacteriaceae bacterium GF1]